MTALISTTVAAVALVVGAATFVQKVRADRRAEWWRRTQWAIDQVTSGTVPTNVAGLVTVAHLLDSPLATRAEQTMLLAVISRVLEETHDAED